MECQHINTCLPCYLNDHHNREGELLLGVFVDGNATESDVLWEVIRELQEVRGDIREESALPGFDYDAAKASVKTLFLLRGGAFDLSDKFDSTLDTSADVSDDADPVQAWFLFTWQKEDDLS